MKQQSAIVESTVWLTPTILGIRLVRPDGQAFSPFQPGQYASLNFPNYQRLKGYRPFSMASSPTNLQRLEFGIRVHKSYTSTLKYLQPGDRVNVQEPFGKFTTHDSGFHPLVLIAGGIGVTPFMSIIRAAAEHHAPPPITLLFSNRTLAETPYREELLTMAQQHSHFNVLFAVSDETIAPNTPRTFAGKITDELVYTTVGETFWPSIFFLCGPPPFMNAMEQKLVTMGIDPKNIHSERFGIKPGTLFEPGSVWPKLIFAGWSAAAAITLALIVPQHKRSAAPAAINTAPIINTPAATNFPVSNSVTNRSAATNTATMINTNKPTNNAQPIPVAPAPQPVVVPRATQS